LVGHEREARQSATEKDQADILRGSQSAQWSAGRLFKDGAIVTHGTGVALTNKGRKLTNRQMPY
jgi:hypothetical protein